MDVELPLPAEVDESVTQQTLDVIMAVVRAQCPKLPGGHHLPERPAAADHAGRRADR